MVQQRRRYSELAFGAFLWTAVKNSIVIQDKRKNLCAKKHKEHIQPGRLVHASNIEEIFTGQRGHTFVPGRTKNVQKIGPKNTRHRHQCLMRTHEIRFLDMVGMFAAMCSPAAFTHWNTFVCFYLD